uniref:ABC transporter subunit C n=1 Tax=Sphaerothecum destruens TaxID=42893 RepID=A0A6H2U2A7_9EUKA|nr:ABC transporter subunit C [Sphaerothecum destruens]QID02696.1 ABC transporter subunit C [Sphaerothecum destruens]
MILSELSVLDSYMWLFFFFMFVYLQYILDVNNMFQGNYMRLLFVHVPLVWLSLLFYLLLLAGSFFMIIYSYYLLYLINIVLSLLYVIVTFVSILTGSIWGYVAWGSYFEMDLRLITMMVMNISVLLYLFLLYLGQIRLGGYYMIFIGINLIVIKYCMYWFSSIHQFSSVNIVGSSVYYSYLYVLFISFIYFIWCLVWLFRLIVKEVMVGS